MLETPLVWDMRDVFLWGLSLTMGGTVARGTVTVCYGIAGALIASAWIAVAGITLADVSMCCNLL